MAAEDMTIGEVARALVRIEQGQSDLRREISERLDRTVSAELYGAQHKAVLDEIAEIKGDLDTVRKDARASESQRVTDRRWWLTAVLIPLATLVASYIAPLVGGGGAT